MMRPARLFYGDGFKEKSAYRLGKIMSECAAAHLADLQREHRPLASLAFRPDLRAAPGRPPSIEAGCTMGSVSV
jgi:hypothetical protein